MSVERNNREERFKESKNELDTLNYQDYSKSIYLFLINEEGKEYDIAKNIIDRFLVKI
jgi:hypothetical protein